MPAKRATTVIRNTPDETFIGLVMLLTALVGLCLGLLMLAARFPSDLATATMLIGSLALGIGSRHYLRTARGALRLSAKGVTYEPVKGSRQHYAWRSVARVSAVPGWMWLHDRRGRKLVSFAFGPTKLASVQSLVARHGRKRARVWPRLATSERDPSWSLRRVTRAIDPRLLVETLAPTLPTPPRVAVDRGLLRFAAFARLAFSPSTRGR
jgi:hypothetical protein